MSHLNGLYLGLDRSNNLCMNIKSRDDCLKWKWEGKILKNKTGLVLDLDVNNEKQGKIRLNLYNLIKLCQRWQYLWI